MADSTKRPTVSNGVVTPHADADANAGHVGATWDRNEQANKAPADQKGFDPKDGTWASLPGAAARANGYPRTV